MSPLVSARMAQCPLKSSLVPSLCFPFRLREEETTPKKKKACALPDLFGLHFLEALMRASRRLPAFLHCRSTYYVVCRCPVVRSNKKKKTTYECYNCHAALMSAIVEPDATFLWSSTFLCKGNSFFHDCTAILRLVHDADSESAQSVQTLDFLSASVASHLSLKKASRVLTTAC